MCEAWAAGGGPVVALAAGVVRREVIQGLLDRAAEAKPEFYWLPVPMHVFRRIQKAKAKGAYRPRKRRRGARRNR